MREPLELSADWPLFSRRLALIATSGLLGLGLLLASLGLEARPWAWSLSAAAAWFWLPSLVLEALRRAGIVVWLAPDPDNSLRLSQPWALAHTLRRAPRDLVNSSTFCLLFLFNYILASAALLSLLYLQSRRLAALFFFLPCWFVLHAAGFPPRAQVAAYIAYFALVYLATT